MRILKKGNSNTRSSVQASLVRAVLEYGSPSWDPYREVQVDVLTRVQRKAAKLKICGNLWCSMERQTVFVPRKQRGYGGKIKDRKKGTDIGKNFFVIRTVVFWNQLPADALAIFPCKIRSFRKSVGNVFLSECRSLGFMLPFILVFCRVYLVVFIVMNNYRLLLPGTNLFTVNTNHISKFASLKLSKKVRLCWLSSSLISLRDYLHYVK